MRIAETCQDERRALEARRKGLNGIDTIEIGKELGGPTLTVYFFGAAPEHLSPKHIAIEGGSRVTGIVAVDVQLCKMENPEHQDCARVLVNKEGDFSIYTLSITGLQGFDPIYSQFDFSFKVDCPNDLDCRQTNLCPVVPRLEPEINYLAKDYASFRQLVLDRWALIMPSWKERHVPDLGITLAEVLAYAGDYLSYYQDAVASEAYLGTARQRISVRRHARLVGYTVHEGCNSRAWICIETSSDLPELNPEDIFFITSTPGVPEEAVIQPDALRSVQDDSLLVFEPVSKAPIRLYAAHSVIYFYTWGNRQCCLAQGSTHATLQDDWDAGAPEMPPEEKERGTAARKKSVRVRKKASLTLSSIEQEGALPIKPADTEAESQYSDASKETINLEPILKLRNLKAGDILVFMEALGPRTGSPNDADREKRHAVRLTRVERDTDELNHQPVVNIWWEMEDALPFPMCLSSLGGAPECSYFEHCTIACANVILADHGRSVRGEALPGYVQVLSSTQTCSGEGRPREWTRLSGTYRPALSSGPLTFCQTLHPDAPASRMLTHDPYAATPQITLQMISLTGVWDVTLDEHHRALLLLQQDGLDLSGSYSGELGADLRVCGSIAQDWSSATFGIYQPLGPDVPLDATVFCKVEQGVLTGTMDGPKGKVPFLAKGRRTDSNWVPRSDLMRSGPRDNHFVVEVDNDSLAHLRFGNGDLGRVPEGGAGFVAAFRLGNGPEGNVSRDSITHMVLSSPIENLEITKITNPLPAKGGSAPETLPDIKLQAPSAFRRHLQRAITADDYATLAAGNPKVQRAAASLRWTGARYAVQVTIDPLGTEKADPALLEDIKHYLYRFRRIGHDLEVMPAHYVPLDLEMTICVRPEFLRAHVKTGVLNALSSARLADGSLGFFHPDNLTFGDSIYVSRLVGTAQKIDGVESVTVTKLERLYQGANRELEDGVLLIGPLEIARLDRDPSFPENGTLKLDMRGGR
ncbi:MAG TPA: putative baseplate assembly protein [Candidatus Angelobacter sp.]